MDTIEKIETLLEEAGFVSDDEKKHIFPKEQSRKIKAWGKENNMATVYDAGSLPKINKLWERFNAASETERKLSNLAVSEITGGIDNEGVFYALSKNYAKKKASKKKTREAELDSEHDREFEQELQEFTFANLNLNNILSNIMLRALSKKRLTTISYKDFSRDIDKFWDGYVYIVGVSAGNNSLGQMISKFTKNNFSHVGLSFDQGLNTLCSFNILDGGGLQREHPLLNYSSITDCYVLRVKIKKAQKDKIVDFIKEVSVRGSSYNSLGLIKNYIMKIKNNKKFLEKDVYTLVCSQFVYLALKQAGVKWWSEHDKNWLQKMHLNNYEYIKPGDFIDYRNPRRVKHVYNGNLYTYYFQNNKKILPPNIDYSEIIRKKESSVFSFRIDFNGPVPELVPTAVG